MGRDNVSYVLQLSLHKQAFRMLQELSLQQIGEISSKTTKNQCRNSLWSLFMVAWNVEGELQILKGMTLNL